MPFRNLYFQLASIRDHNICDFLDRLEEVDEEFLEAKFLEGYEEGMIEPYFDPIIPLTLHPNCWEGFLRTNPKWPITARDYYLSKLFQFLYSPILIRYSIEYRTDVRTPLEEILDQIPDDVLPQLYRWNWWDFYEDTCHLELDLLLERLAERLQAFCERVQQGQPLESTPGEGLQGPQSRRRPRETAERDSIIVHCLSRQMDRFETCRVLDQKAIPTTAGLQAQGIHRWTEAWTNLDTRNSVQQIFSKALKK